MHEPEVNTRKTNVMVLLEILEREGEKDAAQLEAITGIKKPIIVSTLFLAKKRGQIDSRPKSLVALQGRYAFSKSDEEVCKKLSRCGWDVPEIADRLGMTETYVETMLLVAAAPKDIRDMVERGMVDMMNTVQCLKEFGDRAMDNVMAALGAAPKVDGRKVATKGQIYRFLTYTATRAVEREAIPDDPKVDFAAQLADFFTCGVRAAVNFYDSCTVKRTVNLAEFRGGDGSFDGGLSWRERLASSSHLENRVAP